VIVADEDVLRPRRVGRDAVVGALERLPLLRTRRQPVAGGRQRGARVEQEAGGAGLDVRRHRPHTERIGRERDDLQMQRPPSTSMQEPVIIAAASEARKTAVSAMSCGWFRRPSGTVATYWARLSASTSFLLMKVGSMGVCVATGAMATTRTPCGAASSASASVSVTTA